MRMKSLSWETIRRTFSQDPVVRHIVASIIAAGVVHPGVGQIVLNCNVFKT